jgi:ABC-2 type transport system ATP-binding protein
MRILTCFISPTGGSAKVHGFDVFNDPLEVRRRLGYLPQRAPLYHEMSVWDYLEFASQIRGLENSTFKSRLRKVVEVCGLGQVLGKPIGTLSHGYRQRVGLGQALIHDPPILILDEPTADLDPNEKAELLKYIAQIGKDRTILLSTHNLAEVEAACARAIIVSKGKIVADGNLDDIRARSGAVRYTVAIDEQGAEKNSPPSATEVQEALAKVAGARRVVEKPTDETAHRFEVAGAHDGDLRREIFRMVVSKGWTLLELQRDAQSLDNVFRDLTRGDERLDRGSDWVDEDVDEEFSGNDHEADEKASKATSESSKKAAASEASAD